MGRTERIAVFDLDRTILAPPSSERAFFRYLLGRGLVGPMAVVRAATGAVLEFPGGPIAMTKRNKRMWRGWRRDELEAAARECHRDLLRHRIYPEARRTIEHHRMRGDRVILLSGTLDVLLAPIARELGIDETIASRLETAGDRLTGRIEGIHPYGAGKIQALVDWRPAVDPARTIAYADHESDVGLLSYVRVPIAVNPNPGLLRVAEARGWEIRWFDPSLADG